MANFVDVRSAANAGSAGQSFLSLDDGPTSPLVPPDELAARQAEPPERSTSPRSIASRSFGSPHNAYDGTEFGQLEISGDSSSVRRNMLSPKIASPPTKSSRRTILEGTRSILSSPSDASTSAEATQTSNPTTATKPSQGSLARLGAMMGLSSKNTEDRPSTADRLRKAVDGSSNAVLNEPSSSSSVMNQPSSEAGLPNGLGSRFLRSKGSRQRLLELGEEPIGRRDGPELGSAFGLRPQMRGPDEIGRPFGTGERSQGSPSIATDIDMNAASLSQSSRPSHRAQAQANVLDMGSSSSASSSRTGGAGGPASRSGGRLGRLQYKKSEGLSISNGSRDLTSAARDSLVFSSESGGHTSYTHAHELRGSGQAGDAESWQQQQQRSGFDPSSLHRDAAADRGASYRALAGLGIESSFDEEPPSSSSYASNGLYGLADSDPFQSTSGQASNQSARRDFSDMSSQQRSDGYRADALVRDKAGGTWSDGRDASGTAAQPVDSGRTASRAPIQDRTNARFSKQTTSDESRHSTRSSAHSRDAFGHGSDMSPSLASQTSPSIAQHAAQQATASASRRQPQQQQQSRIASSQGQDLRWQNLDLDRSSSTQAGEPSAVPGSPPIGSLSDAAILAMGAIPGVGSDYLPQTNGAPLSSKNVLTIALQKAQSAVQLDSANHVAEAIAAYRQAVRLLDEVMARIAPKQGRRSRPSREEERRRLRVIHDTYADRIRLLSLICAPEDSTDTMGPDSSYDRSTDDMQPRAGREEATRSSRDNQSGGREEGADGDKSFLFLTPVAEQHDISSRDRFMNSRSPPAAEAPASTLDPSTALRDVRPGSSSGRGALSVADEQTQLDGGASGRNVSSNALQELSTTPARQADQRQQQQEQHRRQQEEADANDSQEVLMDPQASNGVEHARSDSDSSFHSTRTKGNVGPSLKPRLRDSPRSLGLDEEAKRPPTPTTPFFDAADTRTSTEEASFDSTPLSATVQSSGGSTAMGDSRRLPRSQPLDVASTSRSHPALKAKSSMPVLSAVRDAAARDAAQNSGRPSSADSPPSDPVRLGSGVETSSRNTEMVSTARDASMPLYKLFGRPRASTLTSRRLPPTLAGTDGLVSASTVSGTISQRRKQAPPQVPALPVPLQSDAMARAKAGENAEGALRGSVGSSAASSAGGSSLSYSRQRATSQPGSRRPSIPAAFLPSSLNADLAPPVPKLVRNLSDSGSMPLGNSVDSDQASTAPPPHTPLRTTSAHGMRRPSMTPLGARSMARASLDEGNSTLRDIFPSGLPSSASGTPSFATGTAAVTLLPWLGLASQLPSPSATPPIPQQTALRPFHIMRTLLHSMQHGGHITQRLYVPKGLWLQQGARLMSIESKVRAMELISTGLESVARGGEPLLLPPGSGLGLETSSGSKFAKHLDELDVLMVEAQNNLAKKLAFLETVAGKKGTTSFGLFGSKLTRSLDRMTNGKSLDSPVIYVEGLARLFTRAQVIDRHLVCLLRSQGSFRPGDTPTPESASTNAYHSLPAELKGSIEAKLRRTSDFFANVILAFVLQDVGVLLDKYAKRGSLIFAE